jgi:hypothetical protein
VTDAFEEVEERLREDKARSFVNKWGVWIVVGILTFASSFWIVSLYRDYQDGVAGKAAITFTAASAKLEAGDFDGAEKDFAAIAKTAPAGYRALAEMKRAAALQGKGDLAGALKAMDAAAGLAREPAIKELAGIKAAYLAADLEDFATLEKRLAPLVAATGPNAFLARELLGVEAYEAGQMDKARTAFEFLTGPGALDAPQANKERASRFLSVVGPAPKPLATPAPKDAAPTSGDKK